MIKRRFVYQLAGYDPINAEAHHERFVRGIATFARTWNVTVSTSDLVKPSDGSVARWAVGTRAGNWRVETTYQPMLWDDIVLADLAGPTLSRLKRSALAFFDFFRTGAAFRYFRANFNYGLFFLFPLLNLAAFAVIGFAIGWAAANYWALAGVTALLTMLAVGIATFLALLRWLGRRWRVVHALDDWIFSWDYLHGRRGDVAARLDRFAHELVERARDPRWDEIVIIGHSIGAALAIDVVARALARDPEFGTHGPAVCVLTVGSTIPKFTLHPGADRIRRDIARVAEAPSIAWAEIHSRGDPISFYGFDPVTAASVRNRFDRKPIIRIVHIHDMLEEKTYRRIRLKFMRLHYQFLMANERRAPYDYYMMGCGPVPFARAVMTMGGAADLIAADGALIGAKSEARKPAAHIPQGGAAVAKSARFGPTQ